MSAHQPPSPVLQPAKKQRRSVTADHLSPASQRSGPGAGSPADEAVVQDGLARVDSCGSGGGGAKGGQSSNFRNVSACNRCRLRKNRCDQRLPSCASCEKAGVACVGYDPITKKEIPRSYVYYLETRIEQLEALLSANNIAFPPAESLEYSSRRTNGTGSERSPTEAERATSTSSARGVGVGAKKSHASQNKMEDAADDAGKLHTLVSKSGLSGVPAASNPRYLGSATGVSFARVVFAAVQSSVSDSRSLSDRGSSHTAARPYKPIAGNGASATGTSMRDSFFGLHTKPTIHPAPFPDRELGHRMTELYFEHANPQIPVLHRGNFMQMFDKAYADPAERTRGPRELYMLNMVFAIGGGIILGEGGKIDDAVRARQAQPEEYHASAIVHLEACLSNSGGGLEELQAVLLLANFALLRPVPPGLWYIIGVAVRLAVDLGLYYEGGKDPEVDRDLNENAVDPQLSELQLRQKGRREFIRDMRRRLWWCTYSFDRLVSVCVGRPFGISDQVITTEFPSLLEDRYISPAGLVEQASDPGEPTYKVVAHHYFRLRLLQSEILQVLQYQQAQLVRTNGQTQGNPFMHADLPSPFLSRYDSFRSWRADIDRRLFEWKNSAPAKAQTGVRFSIEFLDLNYWQAIIMLYRQSLSVPAMFEGEYHTSKEVESPTVVTGELREDEDRVYLKVAEAGQRIIRLYRQLHLIGLVNYTYLATHHLFMAGVSYMYAIWHSPVVRAQLTMDEVDFTVLSATSVLSDLMEKCPPAEACRDAFDRTAKATIKMANSKGGFGRMPPPAPAASPDQWSNYGSRSDTSPVVSRRGIEAQKPASQYGDSPAVSIYTDISMNPTMQEVPKSQTKLDRSAELKMEADAATSETARSSSDATAIDPSLLPPPPPPPAAPRERAASAVTSLLNSMPPAASRTQGYLMPQATAMPTELSQGSLSFADLQGMDFLQSLGGSGNRATDSSDMNGGDTQMDLGFGLGWEGLHHDFSDGQQVDLFDGFFFGGQQGGAGGSGL